MKKILLSILLSLAVFIPFNVNAEEVTGLNVIVDVPVGGKNPDRTADIEFMDSKGNVLLTEKDYPTVWEKVSLETGDRVEMEYTETFAEGYRYVVDLATEDMSIVMQKIAAAGHTIASDGESFINGITYDRGYSSFVINGITSYNVRGQTYEDETLPTTMNVVFETPDGTKEMDLKVNDWYIIRKSGEVEYLEENTVSGYGKETGHYLYYYPVLEFPTEIEDLIDVNTEIQANGETIETKYSESRFFCYPRIDYAKRIKEDYQAVYSDLEIGKSLFLLKSDYRVAKNLFYTLEHFNEEQIETITYHEEYGPDQYLEVAKGILEEAERVIAIAEAIELFQENKVKASAEALVAAYNKYLSTSKDTKGIGRFYENIDEILAEADEIINPKPEETPKNDTLPENPDTGDNILGILITMGISLTGIISLTIYKKKSRA